MFPHVAQTAGSRSDHGAPCTPATPLDLKLHFDAPCYISINAFQIVGTMKHISRLSDRNECKWLSPNMLRVCHKQVPMPAAVDC